MDLQWLQAHEAKAKEPELRCVAALWSENSGIVDCRRLGSQCPTEDKNEYLLQAAAHCSEQIKTPHDGLLVLCGCLCMLPCQHDCFQLRSSSVCARGFLCRLMRAYQRDAEQHGATVMLNSCVVGGDMSGAADSCPACDSCIGML